MKNRLHVLRAERRLTQGALADALGVSRQTVNAIETGKYDPSLPLAFKIASLFGTRIEDIFQSDADPATGPGSGDATRAPLTTSRIALDQG
jgi:putative transcriptional regulator